MKKAVRLIVAAVFLVIVIAAFVAVKYLTKEEVETIEIKPVSQTAVKDIVGVTYISESTSGEAVTLIRENDIWYYEKKKEFPLDQDFVTNTMVAVAAQATANRTLDNPSEDLSQYGFDDPTSTITLKKITGDEVKMTIGSYNEGVEGYYLRIDGDNNIYLVDGQMVFAFDMSVYEIADKEDYPFVEEDSFVHFCVKKGDTTVEFRADEEEDAKEYITDNYYLEKERIWKISKNGAVYKEGNQETIQELVTTIASIDYSKLIEYGADETLKETYGLGEDAVLLTVDYQVLDETTARQEEGEGGISEIVCDTLDKQYVLRIGYEVPEDGFSDPEYYVCMDNSDNIYTIGAESLESIVNMDAKSYEKSN